MLMPRKTKFRKQQRGRRRGYAKGQQQVHFGDYGLKSLDTGWVTNRQIEAARIAMTRHIKRGGKVWINKGEIMPEGFDTGRDTGPSGRLGEQDQARRRGGRKPEGLGEGQQAGRRRSPDREGLGPVRQRRRSGERPGGRRGRGPAAPRPEAEQQQVPPEPVEEQTPAPEAEAAPPVEETPAVEEASETPTQEGDA